MNNLRIIRNVRRIRLYCDFSTSKNIIVSPTIKEHIVIRPDTYLVNILKEENTKLIKKIKILELVIYYLTFLIMISMAINLYCVYTNIVS